MPEAHQGSGGRGPSWVVVLIAVVALQMVGFAWYVPYACDSNDASVGGASSSSAPFAAGAEPRAAVGDLRAASSVDDRVPAASSLPDHAASSLAGHRLRLDGSASAAAAPSGSASHAAAPGAAEAASASSSGSAPPAAASAASEGAADSADSVPAEPSADSQSAPSGGGAAASASAASAAAAAPGEPPSTLLPLPYTGAWQPRLREKELENWPMCSDDDPPAMAVDWRTINTPWNVATKPKPVNRGYMIMDKAKQYSLPALQARETAPWRGLPAVTITPLFKDLHYRPYYFTQLCKEVENRDHVMFLAQSIDVRQARKRIYIDVGARQYESSVLWMLARYPASFDAIYAFEADNHWFKMPSATDLGRTLYEWQFKHPYARAEAAHRMGEKGELHPRHWLAPDASAADEKALFDKLGDIVSRTHYQTAFVGNQDAPGKVDLARFMLSELKLTKDDYVVLKVDIEGGEWSLIPHLLESGAMDVVSELLIEVHYQHPDMHEFGWSRDSGRHFTWTLDEAQQMLVDLRKRGVHAVPWP